jgi:DNA-binding response OmpR family regulator
MIKILLIDDDKNIREMIKEYAQTENWQFFDADTGLKGWEMVQKSVFDLIVIDIMMPVMDGWTALRKIRQDSDVPVIMLTARNEEYDRLLGFELGADDYLGKPFSPKELIARIKALLKRSGSLESDRQLLEFESLTINTQAHLAHLDGIQLVLTPKEYDLLAFLASRPGQAFTRDQLLNHVWGYDYLGDSRTVDTHVRSLRDKLGAHRNLVETVWGMGYRFQSRRDK